MTEQANCGISIQWIHFRLSFLQWVRKKYSLTLFCISLVVFHKPICACLAVPLGKGPLDSLAHNRSLSMCTKDRNDEADPGSRYCHNTKKKNITRKKLNNKGERGQKTIQETEWEQKIIGAEE